MSSEAPGKPSGFSPRAGAAPADGSGTLHRLLVDSVLDYAIFALDANGHVLNWNRGAERLKGYRPDDIIGRHFSTFYTPDDIAAGLPGRLLSEAREAGRVDAEGWRVRRDGARFWAHVVLTALKDESGEVIGFAKVTQDLTAERERQAESRRRVAADAARSAAEARAEELAHLNEQLQHQATELELQSEESQALAEELEQSNEALETALRDAEEARDAAQAAEQFTSSVLASISDPFVVQDASWRFRFINPAAAEFFRTSGRRPESLVGRVVWDVYPELVGTALEREMRHAMGERVPVTFEAFSPERGEWSRTTCHPMPDGGLATQWTDITARKQAEESARYLSRASQVLASSLDYHETLRQLARLVIPELADWCAVDMVGDDGQVRRLAVEHVDPARVALAEQLAEQYPSPMRDDRGLGFVLRTGQPDVYADITDAMLVTAAVDDEHLRLVRALGLRSSIMVPVVARGRIHGALTLVSAESRRRYTSADVELAQELGRRAGLAIDNAKSFAAARAAAERTARLQGVTARLATIVAPQDVAKTVVMEGITSLGAMNGVFCTRTPDGSELEIVHAFGMPERTVEAYRRFRLDAELPLSEAARTGEIVCVESKAAAFERYPTTREANTRTVAESWIALPLVENGHPIGGLAFGFRQPRTFTDEDRTFALALTHQAAQALERSRLYDAALEARATAEAANRAKSDFLATMSHELRTPLNAIGGYTELLDMELHGPLTEAQHESLRSIHRSQRHLQSLIEQILGFARIEAGHLTLTMGDVELGDVIRDLDPLMAPQIQIRGLTFDVSGCEPGLTARADSEKVRQILLNLLSNAVKFTPAGGRITISGHREKDRAVIRVSDTGTGIPADKVEAIFEPFVQLDRTLKSAQTGAGLGLAISRDLARAMGGELTVESQINVGSTFTLSLPGGWKG